MKVGIISSEELVHKMQEPSLNLIIVDCRSGMDFSTWHISGAVNIGGTRNSRREIMSGKVAVLNVLHEQLGRACDKEEIIVVCDQCSVDHSSVQSLSGRVAEELALFFSSVFFLRGGFIGFQSKFGNLCWTNKHKSSDEDFVTPAQSLTDTHSSSQSDACVTSLTENTNQSFPRSQTMVTLTTPNQTHTNVSTPRGLTFASSGTKQPQLIIRQSLSGPALPSSREGPTTVLPYLLLGTQQDALSQPCIRKHGITHVINVSTDGLMCPFVPPQNFIRIPILDNFADKITTYFPKAFKFLDDVKMTGGRALVHCSAGISRSPTLAIGYLMKAMQLSVTEAYNIVKSTRTSVSPNFNFMGQLTDYEKSLQTVIEDREASMTSSSVSNNNKSVSSRQKRRPSRLGFLSTLLRHRVSTSPPSVESSLTVPTISTPLLPSPSAPFARLGINSPMEESSSIKLDNFPATSLDQLHVQPCQTGPRGIKIKRSATMADNDSSKIRKQTESSLIDTDWYGGRRHSSVIGPLSLEDGSSTKDCCVNDTQNDRPVVGRSVSYERINSVGSTTVGQVAPPTTILSDCCRVQECHQSSSSLSSANSHNSNLLV